MPSYTTSLRLVQPSTGEYSGTWGTQVNTGLTALVDASIAGTATITMTAANYTLSNNNGASDEARAMFLVMSGTPGGSYNVIVPAVSKLYFVTNSTGAAQTVKTSAGSGISVPNGARMTLRCDGTDVVVAQNYFASLTLGAALPVASGGTGITSFGTGVATALGQNVTGSGSIVLATGPTLGAATFTGNAQTTPVAVTFNATTMTVNCALSNVFTTTFTANVTTAPTISNPQNGQTINWFITQDATGSRTMTWPTSFKWPTGAITTLSTSANSVDLLTATYLSSTGFWYASLLKQFV
jgi:hypothetical protein